ncbi:uncharacterized protein LOC105071405 isoform X2 [Camelus bactrianus]|uniref:Uncharacterized protein LOC105071405 isoform X2 n=3 Tax=Camelus bactrianus TaxID=9837 RepID=A0AC58PF36_CAMBA
MPPPSQPLGDVELSTRPHGSDRTEIRHTSDIIWYLSFSFWLTSPRMMISRSLHVAASGFILFTGNAASRSPHPPLEAPQHCREAAEGG